MSSSSREGERAKTGEVEGSLDCPDQQLYEGDDLNLHSQDSDVETVLDRFFCFSH